MVIVSNKNKIKLIRIQKEKQLVTAHCVSEKICDSWSMSELGFPLSELRKLEEGGEYFCSCMALDTSYCTRIAREHLMPVSSMWSIWPLVL